MYTPVVADEANETVALKLRSRGSRIAFETYQKKQVGSISGRHFGPEELGIAARLEQIYRFALREAH